MTLCIAWKHGIDISFISDSRLSFPDGTYIDTAIKIFSLPVKIYTPVDHNTDTKELAYEGKIGLCCAGNLINAYAFKESISEILQQLQYVPGYTDTSLEGLCQFIANFFEHIYRTSCEKLYEKGLGEFLICGWCPNLKKPRIFRLLPDTSTSPIGSILQEVLLNTPHICIGSGGSVAEQIILTNPHVSMFDVLRQVIHDENIPRVGGNIQYGIIRGRDFVIEGVCDFSVDTEGRVMRSFVMRGPLMHDDRYFSDVGSFHISYDFIDPFHDDIADLMQQRKSQGKST